jgi:hypothetical protein
VYAIGAVSNFYDNSQTYSQFFSDPRRYERHLRLAAVSNFYDNSRTYSQFFVIIAGMNVTGDKLLPAKTYYRCADTLDYALPRNLIDSMTPAINLSPVTTTPAMHHRREQRHR